MSSASNPSGHSPPPSALTHVQQHWDGIRPNSPIYSIFFSSIELVSATSDPQGRVVARLPLAAVHINSKGILHGAVSAALVDWAGGMAIAAGTGRDRTGVSVDIHISYVGPAKAGDVLEVEAWVNRAGATLAYTSVEIRKVGAGGERGGVVATGSHTKYLK